MSARSAEQDAPWAARCYPRRGTTDAATFSLPDVTIASEAIEGAPAQVLTRAARDADMLVLGSHGHGRLYDAILGSVAQACVRAATCPVLIVPVPHAERASKLAEVQKARV